MERKQWQEDLLRMKLKDNDLLIEIKNDTESRMLISQSISFVESPMIL